MTDFILYDEPMPTPEQFAGLIMTEEFNRARRILRFNREWEWLFMYVIYNRYSEEFLHFIAAHCPVYVFIPDYGFVPTPKKYVGKAEAALTRIWLRARDYALFQHMNPTIFPETLITRPPWIPARLFIRFFGITETQVELLAENDIIRPWRLDAEHGCVPVERGHIIRLGLQQFYYDLDEIIEQLILDPSLGKQRKFRAQDKEWELVDILALREWKKDPSVRLDQLAARIKDERSGIYVSINAGAKAIAGHLGELWKALGLSTQKGAPKRKPTP